MSTPTQQVYPWRTMLRTIFQAGVALAVTLPVVASEFGLDASTGGIVGGVLLVCGIVARVMAMPSVNDFLAKFLPFLTPEPKPADTNLED